MAEHLAARLHVRPSHQHADLRDRLRQAALLERWGSQHAVSALVPEGDAETVLVRRAQSYVFGALRAFLDALQAAQAPRPLVAAE